MFIKEIKLYGLKSYQEETIVSELGRGLNVIVGRNGSGKSNIFSAIEFALTMEYQNMKPETRNSLISQGRNEAFVEIVLDNSERKLPVDADTVTFRRNIFSKAKDAFFVNGKELSNAKKFLESAGFSNPYFIIKQGKVHDLALASDAARLKVITDVTGTTVYDGKIAECTQTMEAAVAKQREIKTKLTELKKRKDELEEEVKEQRNYMKMDVAKRSIECILHTRKVQELENSIAELERSRNGSSVRQKPVREALEKVKRDIQIFSRDLDESKSKIKQLHESKNDYEVSMNQIATDLAYKEQEHANIKNKETTRNQDQSAAATVVSEIFEYKDLLKKVESEVLQIKEEMDMLFSQKCQLETRANQFKNKRVGKGVRALENANGNSLSDITNSLNMHEQQLTQLMASEKALQDQLCCEEADLKKLRVADLDYQNQCHQVLQNINEYRTEDHRLKSRIIELSREINETEQNIAEKRRRLKGYEEDWKKVLGSEIFHGWIGVNEILDEFHATGNQQHIVDDYHGLVCEIIECDPKLDVAVEVAGGKRLLYHVVGSKATAKAIITEFNARNLRGEVHFYPVHDLKPSNKPSVVGLKGTTPLVNLTKFPDDLQSVGEMVFGCILLCKNFDTATQTMKQHKLECITLEGDKVSKVGVMKGGYRRYQPQKLELYRAKRKDEEDVTTFTEKLEEMKKELIESKDMCHTLGQKFAKYRNQYSHIQENKRQILSNIFGCEQRMLSLQDTMKCISSDLTDTRASIKMLEEMAKSPANRRQPSKEKIELMEQVKNVTAEYKGVETKYNQKCKERNELDAKLKQAKKRYAILQASLPNSANGSQKDVLRISEEIDALTLQIRNLEALIGNVNREILIVHKLVLGKQKLLDAAIVEENRLEEELGNVCNELDSFAVNHSHLMKKLEELTAEGSKLGSVAADLNNYEILSEQELYKKLRKLNSKLSDSKKVAINQKALQQYDELQKNCDRFEARMGETVRCKKELTILLKDVCSKRGEAMLRNVRLIQEQFHEMFCKIVPQGTAELIFYGKDISIDHSTDIEDPELMEVAGSNNFEGVKVSVNFIGKQLHMTQSLAPLSGGQKSVIALCLILAIQSIDPAPFYLFDEADQALDSAYRVSVARLISEMSDERFQFICTTFRKELVDVADKIYGVSFENRCSHIRAITESQALNFVESDYSPLDSSSISTNETASMQSSAD